MCHKAAKRNIKLSSFLRTPTGLEDASRYPKLFAELLKDKTWSLQDLKKLAGLNFLRVFTHVEQVRDVTVGQLYGE